MTANLPSVAKKSENGTSPKKWITGSIRASTIPTVMATDSSAEAIRTALIAVSAGRGRFARFGDWDGPAAEDGPAPAAMVLMG